MGSRTLRRVHEGGVTRLGEHFFNQGRPVADYLATALDDLIRSEMSTAMRCVSASPRWLCRWARWWSAVPPATRSTSSMPS